MSVYNDYKAPGGTGGVFLRLEVDKPVKVRILSEPYIFTQQFNEESPIQTKYAWVVYNHDESKAQILQLPITGFRQVQELAQESDWGNPTGYNLTVKRTGQGLETKYSVIPGLKGTLNTEAAAKGLEIDIPSVIKGALPLERIVSGEQLPKPAVSDAPPVESRNPEGEIDVDSIPF